MVDQNKKQISGGLLPLPRDSRDLRLGAVFGTIDIKEVPDTDFMVAEPLKIKDQGTSDLCVAFALCAVSEDQEKVLLEPAYTFAKIKEMMGDWQSWGADLRVACKVAVKIGFIKEYGSPYNLENGRDFVANWANWPPECAESAQKHRKMSYFRVDGPYDTFDNMRVAMWQHRAEKRSILTGAIWQREWTGAEQGVIEEQGTPGFGHSFKINGQKNIGGELFLSGQLSNGKEIGNKGLFYFSREVVNKGFKYGAFMFKDLSPEKAKKIAWPIWRRILEKVKTYFREILK